MSVSRFRVVASILLLTGIGCCLPAWVGAAPIILSGTITYQGTSSGDSLFVAAIDTAGVEDVTLLDLEVHSVGASPITQAFSLQFDNAGVSPTIFIAAFLDVDGGGIADIGGADVFGWYGEQPTPTAVSTANSQSGLDFALPRAEIHGTLTLADGQTEARIDVSQDVACSMEGFRPGTFLFSSGSYAVIGVYAGSYCVNATGNVMGTAMQVCYGDPSCVSPNTVTLSANEVRSGIDLDFSVTAVQPVTWEHLKTLYR